MHRFVLWRTAPVAISTESITWSHAATTQLAVVRDMQNSQRRTWADVLALVAAIWTIAQSIWGPMLLSQGSQDRGASTSWVMSIVAGAMALVGLWLAQRRPPVGRALVAAGGVLVLAIPFTYRWLPPLPMTGAIVAGSILLLSAKFVGPLPPPEHTPRTSGVTGRS
jgi:hypothetical protein